jgi:hypothetical protein
MGQVGERQKDAVPPEAVRPIHYSEEKEVSYESLD